MIKESMMIAPHRNGTLDQLCELLETETLEETFFKPYRNRLGYARYEIGIHNPIITNDDATIFFGNFENVSFVFSITTRDQKLINRLTPLIKNNRGWKLYYLKNLENYNELNRNDPRQEHTY